MKIRTDNRMLATSIGFTGTQNGMTELQKDKLLEILKEGERHGFHHGDCIGSDAEAHEIASNLKYIIIAHPPSDDSKRAFCDLVKGDILLEVKPYLDRNKDIVTMSDVLLACPFSKIEATPNDVCPKGELRNGTWSTVRYARKTNKPIILIYPNGTINDEQGVLA